MITAKNVREEVNGHKNKGLKSIKDGVKTRLANGKGYVQGPDK
jgi:hypothetical protein